jgi:2'-5' RNA ligase
MARNLPSHLSQKSALVLLPPASIASPIDAVRRVYDKHFDRWPAHINLLYPFRSSPSETVTQSGESAPTLKQDLRVRIERATQKIQPFQLSLNATAPGTFHHSPKSKTVWLGPTTQSVHDLQAALQSEFSECDSDQRPYTPHLSLGQARDASGVEKLEAKIQETVDSPTALSWNVDRIFVIERKNFKDRFKVVGTIELGKE